jgi:hypothetical protein
MKPTGDALESKKSGISDAACKETAPPCRLSGIMFLEVL